jgi:Rrf2 family transcriptional regulator, iron-sulfur cluster assembly transcription factor
MKITQAGEYGLLALIYLARQPVERLIMADEISKAERVPKTFLSKILQNLSKAGIIRSKQGVNGGFALAKKPGEITVLQAIEAIEGKIALQRCLEETPDCDKMDACTLCAVLTEAQNRVTEVFSQMTLADMMQPKDKVLEKCRELPRGPAGLPIREVTNENTPARPATILGETL